MSNQPTKKGHWESHSYAARATKIDDNPPVITGKESSAQGTFNVSYCFMVFHKYYI